MILWHFFHKYFIRKKTQSVRCLSLLDREGDGVAKWIRVGDRGDRWAENSSASDLIVDVFTGLDITCSGREVKRVQVAEQPGGRWRDVELYESVQMLQSFNIQHLKVIKKKKKIPTDRPTLWKVISGQSNNLFFLA